MTPSYKFDNVTLLVTHYNRSTSLERLLKGFQELNCRFGDIVVSDDCSKPEHLNYIRKLEADYSFRLVTTPVNKGLANNLNKGQEAVQTPYTLYVQEDFIPERIFPENFAKALQMMDERPDLDFIRFYSYLPYPYVKPYKSGYSEMLIKPLGFDYTKIYFYSDHPHLRRSNFLERFGRYEEGIPSDKTEYRMCISVFQKHPKGLLFDNYKSLFNQYNPDTEPSTVSRSSLTHSQNPIIKPIRAIYRILKYNYDILFFRPNKLTSKR